MFNCRHSALPSFYKWCHHKAPDWTAALPLMNQCLHINNKWVSQQDGGLFDWPHTIFIISLHYGEYPVLLLFWLISWGLCFWKPCENWEEIASPESVFPLTTPHLSFFYCAKSVEKMKQPDGPRAIRTVRVRAFVFLSDPTQSPVLTQAAAGISRGTKKQISACRSLRCATASPRWWLNPRSVSGSFVLLLTTCVTV